MSANFPFIGIVHNFMKIKGNHENALGPIRAYVQTKHALGNPTYPHSSKGFPLGITLRIIRKIAHWKMKGMNKPSAFFDDNGQAVSKPAILGD